MPDIDVGRLHDRRTRGESLSAAEETLLLSWYTTQDEAEQSLLAGVPTPEENPPAAVTALREQVDAALVQVTRVAQQIKRLTRQNESLRQQNARLKRQLANRVDYQVS